jgi:hypothetical protein
MYLVSTTKRNGTHENKLPHFGDDPVIGLSVVRKGTYGYANIISLFFTSQNQ